MRTEPEPEPVPEPLRRLTEAGAWTWVTVAFCLSLVATFGYLARTTAHVTPFDVGAVVLGAATLLWRRWMPDDPRRDPVTAVANGAALLIVGFKLLAFGVTVVLTACWLLCSLWWTADGVQRLRHGPPTVETDDAEGSTDDRRPVPEDLADAIERRLDGTPLTRREIRERVGAAPEQVDAVLAHLRDAGRIERAGSAYRTTEAESSAGLDSLRDWLAGVRDPVAPKLTRLAWPLTVEFGADARDEHPVDRSTGTTDGSESTGTPRAGSDAERDHDRDREPELSGG